MLISSQFQNISNISNLSPTWVKKKLSSLEFAVAESNRKLGEGKKVFQQFNILHISQLTHYSTTADRNGPQGSSHSFPRFFTQFSNSMLLFSFSSLVFFCLHETENLAQHILLAEAKWPRRKMGKWNFSIVFLATNFLLFTSKSSNSSSSMFHILFFSFNDFTLCGVLSARGQYNFNYSHLTIFQNNLTIFTRKIFAQITFHFQCYK